MMAKRNKKTKDKLIQEIFEDNPEIIQRNNNNLKSISINKSAIYPNDNKIENDIFLTNLSMVGLNDYKN